MESQEQTPGADPVINVSRVSKAELEGDYKKADQAVGSKQVHQIMEWDDHKIGIRALCDRFGYRSDYFLKVGVTNSYVQYQQNLLGKNELTTYMSDMGQMFAKIFGGCVSQSLQDQCSNTPMPCSAGSRPSVYRGGEIDMNSRLSYVPIPVAHVLRDGKKYLVDAKDIIVSDIVYLDAKVSGVIPADIILIETAEEEEFVISSYLDTFDHSNKHLWYQRQQIPAQPVANQPPAEGEEPAQEAEKKALGVPETAVKKKVVYNGSAETLDEIEPPVEGVTDFILDSTNFVPMGSRLMSGQGRGICIRIGNNTVKGLLR